MRVIRTEMYFDDVVGTSRRPHYRLRRELDIERNHGLSFAWFRSDFLGPFDITNDKLFRLREISIDEVRPHLDAILRDHDGRDVEFDKPLRPPEAENPQIIDFVYEQTIILEHSPPESVPFKDLLKRTNAPIYVGAFMGAGISRDYPALMVITIPLGIIIVGSALGIAEGMAAGLNKRVKQMFDRRKK